MKRLPMAAVTDTVRNKTVSILLGISTAVCLTACTGSDETVGTDAVEVMANVEETTETEESSTEESTTMEETLTEEESSTEEMTDNESETSTESETNTENGTDETAMAGSDGDGGETPDWKKAGFSSQEEFDAAIAELTGEYEWDVTSGGNTSSSTSSDISNAIDAAIAEIVRDVTSGSNTGSSSTSNDIPQAAKDMYNGVMSDETQGWVFDPTAPSAGSTTGIGY